MKVPRITKRGEKTLASKRCTVLTDQADRKRAYLRRALLAWFRHNARDLPWRRTHDPYLIWLAEIVLQQTRMETGLRYYERLSKAFPTVRDLAAADEDRLLKLWEGLGYYTRARNLRRAAKIIVTEFGARFPTTESQWEQLPGVGRYTAGAVASIVFGERVPILDGNAQRLLARIFNVTKCMDEPETKRLLWAVAEELVPSRSPGQFNQALMELGSLICTPRSPRCDVCPVREKCEARALGRQSKLPVRRPKKRSPHYDIVAAAIRKNGRYLLGKRPAGGMLGGLWEFPGGKVKRGETREQALVREIEEELGIGIVVGRHVISVHHAYSHFAITLHLYLCRHVSGRPKAHDHSELKWIVPREFRQYAFPAADLKFLHLLR